MDVPNYSRYTDFEWAIQFNRLYLHVIGLWHSNVDHALKFPDNIRFGITVGTITLFCLLPGFSALKKVWGNLILMTDNLNYTLSVCATLVKLFVMWLKRRDFAVLNDMILADWLRTNREKEINIMKKWGRLSRIISIGNMSTMLLAIIANNTLPALGLSVRFKTHIDGIDDRLLMQSYFFYNTSRNSHFVFTYFMQNMGLIAIAFSFSGIDSYLALLVFHVCGQLQNLNERLMNLNEFKHFKYTISYCVEEHIRLFRFMEIIDNSFTTMLLLIVMYLTVLFCFQGFIIVSEINERNISIGRTCMVLFGITITLGNFCIFCIIGEILSQQCELLYNTVCNCKWYGLKPNEAKCIVLLMIRAGKPMYITAGKLFPMMMATFCSLLKTSGGYVSVLLAQQNLRNN